MQTGVEEHHVDARGHPGHHVHQYRVRERAGHAEALTERLVGSADARHLDDVDAGAQNHVAGFTFQTFALFRTAREPVTVSNLEPGS